MFCKNRTRGSAVWLACFILLACLVLATPSIVQAQNKALKATGAGQTAISAASSAMTRFDSECQASPITVGQTINGTLADTDCYYTDDTYYWYADLYSFTATAGQQVAITMTSTGFDTWLELYQPDGTLLADNDDSSKDTSDSRIPPGSGAYTLPVSGTYKIAATSYWSEATGAYILSLTGEAECNPPTVVTNNASSVTTTSGALNGYITANGGAAVTEYGFYWGTSATPATKVTVGTGNITGAFNYTLSGLTQSKTYYFKAYATNSAGTGFGLVKSFPTSGDQPIDPLDNWQPSNSGTPVDLKGITYDNGSFVVAGDYGVILTSPDGVTWTERVSGTYDFLYEITYGNGAFVVVGADGIILTSPDGVTWTERVSGTYEDLLGLTYGNGIFLTTGDYGTILTSPDGVTWTERVSGVDDDFDGVTYNIGTFVTVGADGAILTSPDGVTWTERVSGTTNYLREVTYGNGAFVAVGSGGVILTSPDGVTWTERVSGTTNGVLEVICDRGIFLAAGSDGTILTSPDSVTWTERISGLTNNLREAAYGNGAFVVVGDEATIIRTVFQDTEPVSPPGVQTNDPTNIDKSSATLNGTILENGGAAITEYGFYWGTSATPTTKVIVGAGNITGAISFILSGLNPGMTYYFKAYATNSADTGYGLVKSFTTTGSGGSQTILTAPVVQAAPGSASQIPIKLTSQGNVSGLQFDLSFNSDLLTYVSGTNGSLTSGFAFTASLYEPGKVRVVIYSPANSNIPLGEGDVALLTLQAAPGALSGQNCALTLSNVSMSDAAAIEIADYSLVNGSFTVAVCAKGDVNGDDLINVQDVVRTVNIILGKLTPTDTELCAADVNSDDTINVQDVVRMVNIILGKA